MFIEALAKMWSVMNPTGFNRRPDFIALVSHGATDKRLTNGAAAATSAVNKLRTVFKKMNEDPPVYFGTYTDSKNPELERREKEKLLGESNIHYVGNVLSTIEECMKIKKALPEEMAFPLQILVVTDEAHSRRARIVWETFFPETRIAIFSVPIKEVVDKESPMWAYHWAWTTLAFQAGPSPYFWWLSLGGPAAMEKKKHTLHQPAVK